MRASICVLWATGLAPGLACTPSTPPAHVPESEAPRSSAPVTAPAAACASVPATSDRFARAVDGAHRGCTDDAQCHTVRLDCSNVHCSGVHRDHAAAYADPLDCEGYDGPMANYDCMPQFDIEAPRCVDGCCVSERITPP